MAIAIERSLPSGLDAFTRHLEDPSLTREERARILRIAENLSKPFDSYGPRASNQGFEETLYRIAADGAQVSATTTETIMVPDFIVRANYMLIGRTLKYTIYFDWSTVVTTPGTMTLALRWGGVAGTVLCTSGAFAPDPTSLSTTITGRVEFLLTCRAEGTSGSILAMGNMILSDYDDATVTAMKGNLDMLMIPTSAPAAVTVDTTVDKALSPTVKFSVATAGTQFRAHLATLEAMN